jgi:aldehyde dehydrogenase (NAD+)
MDLRSILNAIGLQLDAITGHDLPVDSPIDGNRIAVLRWDSDADIERKLTQAVQAFERWRDVPAPKRGNLIRLFAEQLRVHKEYLAQLVTIENGKILEEARGEVQEMIDICDFAVGLSRQLYGLTIASERPQHTMQESWLPLGPVGIITAFNFPVAVWSWNTALALVCGDPVLWKPSEKTPLSALACQALLQKACAQHGETPDGLSAVVIGDHTHADQLVQDRRLPLISATGSCRMGHIVGPKVTQRFGRCLLELGGNNAIIVSAAADLDLALPSIVFGAVGTAGQRCTTTRRVIAHEAIYDTLFARLEAAYQQIASHKIGNPLAPTTLVGPLIDQRAYDSMQQALQAATQQGGEVRHGARVLADVYPDAWYVEPALVKLDKQTDIVRDETFAPILYVMPYTHLDDAIAMHNDVAQGLSSAIFTTDLREASAFLQRSDCGIANVNIGTSGAEIGGAFGGEKATGGGRESGSDAWKQYMRRQTSTTYYGSEKPALAQGIQFDIAASE